jgi:hypothetical protein
LGIQISVPRIGPQPVADAKHPRRPAGTGRPRCRPSRRRAPRRQGRLPSGAWPRHDRAPELRGTAGSVASRLPSHSPRTPMVSSHHRPDRHVSASSRRTAPSTFTATCWPSPACPCPGGARVVRGRTRLSLTVGEWTEPSSARLPTSG